MMFEELKIDPSYEIAKDQYPYIIRKKGKSKPIKPSPNNTGYLQIRLSGKMYSLHRVIATQYLDNPNNYNEVDHIDHDKSNNRIENLRYVSHSENVRNKAGYNGYEATYVGELTDDAIEVTDYCGRRLEFYYFDQDRFFFYNGLAYRELHINVMKSTGALFVSARDIENNRVKIYLNKFKREHDLI